MLGKIINFIQSFDSIDDWELSRMGLLADKVRFEESMKPVFTGGDVNLQKFKEERKITMALSDFERMSEELAEAKEIIANYDTIRDTDRAEHQKQIEQRVAQIDNLHTALDEMSQTYEAEHAARVMLTEKFEEQVEAKSGRRKRLIEELMDDNDKLKVQLVIANTLLEKVKEAFIECDAHLLYILDGREVAWEDYSKYCPMDADCYRIAAGAALLKVMK